METRFAVAKPNFIRVLCPLRRMFSHRLKQKARVCGPHWQCRTMQMSHVSFLVTTSHEISGLQAMT